MDVSLFWSERARRLTVEVFDEAAGSGFELDVSGSEAFTVFDDPYAYATRVGVSLPRHPVSRLPYRPAAAPDVLRRAA